jgi:hypothetical protein
MLPASYWLLARLNLQRWTCRRHRSSFIVVVVIIIIIIIIIIGKQAPPYKNLPDLLGILIDLDFATVIIQSNVFSLAPNPQLGAQDTYAPTMKG